MDGLLAIYARAATPPTELQVSYTPTQLSVYLPIAGTQRFTREMVRRSTGSNKDVYAWVASDIVAYTPSGWIKERQARATGEQQFAMSINATLGGAVVSDGAEIFVGGDSHGREVLSQEPVVEIDGSAVDITGSGDVTGDVLTVETVSTVYEIGTTNPILTKTTTLTFDYATGKVTMEISLECIGTTASLVAPQGFVPRQMYVGMDCGLRALMTVGSIPPTQLNLDLTDESGEASVTNGTSDCRMTGTGYGMRCQYLSGWSRSGRSAIINDAIEVAKAKIYHNIAGFGVAVVNVGETISAEVEWTYASAATIAALA